MTKRQNAVLSAYQKMLLECDKAPETVAKITVFKAKISRVREIVAEIQTLSPLYSESNKGNTDAKNDRLEDLVFLTDMIAGAIHSHAKETDNTQLVEKVKYKQSDFAHTRQDLILNAAKIVLNNAKFVSSAELAEVGISVEDMAEFTELIDQIETMVPDNEITKVEKTAMGERIRTLFAELADIKSHHLNRLSKQFIRKDPDFYYLYKSTMVVKYSSSKKKDTPETDNTTTT